MQTLGDRSRASEGAHTSVSSAHGGSHPDRTMAKREWHAAKEESGIGWRRSIRSTRRRKEKEQDRVDMIRGKNDMILKKNRE